jgi:hypothetical protein
MAVTNKRPRKKSSAHTPQTGMEPGPDPKAAEQAVEDQFAEADAKADPSLTTDEQALADLQVQRSVRGW